MKSMMCAFILLVPAGSLWAQPVYRIISDIPNDAGYADSVIKVSADRLHTLIGPIEIDSLVVYIVASERKFDSLAGGFIPDWGAAVAIPLRRRIVIKSPLILPGDKSLGELVAHEFTHVALARSVRYRPVPRWLDEGMAMYMSAEWRWDDDLAMSWAILLGGFIPLQEIESVNRFQGDQVRTAYSEAYLAFKYFIDTYGDSGLRILLDNIKYGRRLDYAFVVATGADYNAFGQEIATFLTGRYNVLTTFFSSNLFWIVLALIFIIGFILSRFRRKKRFEELDEYDKYHSSDFDYGNVEEPDEDKPWD